jgi:hypothetical protein
MQTPGGRSSVHGSVVDIVTLAPPPLPVVIITVPLGIFAGVKEQTTLPRDMVQLSDKVAVGDCIVTSNGIVVAAVAPRESLTATETENVPLVVGVPDSVPVSPVSLSVNPGAELVPEKVYGAVPPDAVIAAEYAVPATAPGKDVVEIASGAFVVSEAVKFAKPKELQLESLLS